MIKIQIENEERKVTSNIDVQWINQHINLRQDEGQTICVRVTIKEGDLNMLLTTPKCGNMAGNNRRPSPEEDRIFDLWKKHGLRDENFNGANVVAFLSQLKQFL
jgi:hypothetical protein